MTAPPHDRVIRGGLVFDGSGGEPVREDVAIGGSTIVARSSRSGPIAANGAREIDARGLWVTPGFLDIHTHYDAELEVSPGLEESVRHGVTTVVMGNCSLSLAMGSADEICDIFTRVESLPRDLVKRWLAERIQWSDAEGYYDHLERDVPMGPNVASFLGHSNLRMAVMGLSRSTARVRPDESELALMERRLRDAMEAGYLGLSIDMLPYHRMDGGPFLGAPLPSHMASYRERNRLTRVLREHDRVLQAAPSAESKASVLWLLGASAGYRVRRALKTTIVAALDIRRIPWGHRAVSLLAGLANRMLGARVRFQALASPFRVYSDGPVNPFFDELPTGARALSAGADERRRLFADPAFRAQFRREWNGGAGVFHRRFDEMTILHVPERPEWAGLSFAGAARTTGIDPLELFMDLVARWDDGFRWVADVANHRPAIRRRLLGHRHMLPGFSDAGAHTRNQGFQDACLQLLRQAAERPDWMTPSRAIARITREPAEFLGLDAGTLDEGARADVVVLDPEELGRLGDDAVEARPPFMDGAMRMVRRSDGVVRHVLIGGKTAFRWPGGLDPDLGQKRLGRLLRVRGIRAKSMD